MARGGNGTGECGGKPRNGVSGASLAPGWNFALRRRSKGWNMIDLQVWADAQFKTLLVPDQDRAVLHAATDGRLMMALPNGQRVAVGRTKAFDVVPAVVVAQTLSMAVIDVTNEQALDVCLFGTFGTAAAYSGNVLLMAAGGTLTLPVSGTSGSVWMVEAKLRKGAGITVMQGGAIVGAGAAANASALSAAAALEIRVQAANTMHILGGFVVRRVM